MPIHGEYRMLAAHAQLARDAGVPEERIVIAENGSVVELTPDGVRHRRPRHRGRDVRRRARSRRRRGRRAPRPEEALGGRRADRRHDRRARRRRDEIAPPELIARGVGEDTELVEELREEASRIAAELSSNGVTEIKLVQEHIHDAIAQVVYDRTRRRPMILPVVIEV